MINRCNPLDCFVSDLLPGCHRAFIARSLEDIRILSPGVSPTAGHFDFISPVFLQGVIALIAICDKDPSVSFQIVPDDISCSGAVIVFIQVNRVAVSFSGRMVYPHIILGFWVSLLLFSGHLEGRFIAVDDTGPEQI